MTTGKEARQWVEVGTRRLLSDLDGLSDTDLDQATTLSGWTRRHLLAHVASNAQAIERLLLWAATGTETPMYSSLEQRATEIEQGAVRPDLREWVSGSARSLAGAAAALPVRAWSAEVVTIQGRTVPASETWWMRAREVCIHAVDLNAGMTFAQLPDDFLIALINDVVAWRTNRPGPEVLLSTPHTRHHLPGRGTMAPVDLPLATAAAWLVGRHHDPALPTLPKWL